MRAKTTAGQLKRAVRRLVQATVIYDRTWNSSGSIATINAAAAKLKAAKQKVYNMIDELLA